MKANNNLMNQAVSPVDLLAKLSHIKASNQLTGQKSQLIK